jgi:hypothetical protein
MPRPIDPPAQDANNKATYGGNIIPPEPPGLVDPFFDAVSRQWKDRYVSTQDPEPAAPPYSFEFPTGTPSEPVSPFDKFLVDLESLQPPVGFTPGSYQGPSTPSFTPTAAPTAVRVSPPATSTEPVSPFEKYLMDLENLQSPVEFKPGLYEGPSTPTFTPMDKPSAVQVSPPAQFGPVTPSGYAQPPVDPLSYYSDPEIIPETPLVGDPDLSVPNTLTPRKPSKPILVGDNVEPVPPDIANVGGGGFRLKRMELSDAIVSNDQEQLNPVAEQLSASPTIINNPNTGLPIEVVPNPDFVEPRVPPNPPRINLPDIPPGMLDPVMDYDQWKWVDRYIPKPDKPSPPTEDENVKYLTDKEVEDLTGDQTPTPPVPPQDDVPILPTYNVVRDVITTNRPNVPIPKPYQFKEYPTQTSTGITRREGKIIPFKMPTEVPIPPRREAGLLAPGYSQDINYDPDEILAAAMRVLRGRGAGRSLTE